MKPLEPSAAPIRNSGAALHPLTTLLHGLSRGGGILQVGLADPEPLIELSRRGARALGFDRDPRRVAAAVARNAEARGTARFETWERGVWSDGVRMPADVVVFESLAEGGEATLELETAFSEAAVVVIPAAFADRLPDRFAAQRVNGFLDLPCALDAYCVLTGSPPQPSGARSGFRFVSTDGARTLGARRLVSNFENAASRHLQTGSSVSVVVDPGLVPKTLDASLLAYRDLEGPSRIVFTSTRTDRFSREHVTVLRTFDEVWVPCSSQRGIAIRCGLDAHRVHVVPVAIDTDRFQPAPKPRSDFRVLALVSSPARLDEAMRAARAFAEELGEEPDASLTVALAPGLDEGAVAAQLDATLAGLPARARAAVVCLALAQDAAMELLYVDFDLFVRPSQGERRGLAILEAMACGVPVAATRFGIAGECVHDGNGYTIELDGLEACEPAAGSCDVDEAGHLRAVPSHASIRRTLRQAYSDRAGLAARALQARSEVVLRHSTAAVARTMASISCATPAPRTVAQAPAIESTEETDLAGLAEGLESKVSFDLTGPVRSEFWCQRPIDEQNALMAGVASDAIHLVPAAVRCDVFRPEQRPAILPTRARLRILTVAADGWESGADLAVRCFVEAKVRHASLVVAAADPDTRVSLQKLAASLDPAAEVVFVDPPASAIARAALVNACHLFLDFSRRGSNGQAILEAAACEKPSLASPLGLPEGILDGRTGFAVAARVKVEPPVLRNARSNGRASVFLEVDPTEAAAALRSACADASARERRGAAARARALEHQPSRLEAWVDARRRALTGPRPRRAPRIAVVAPSGTDISQLPETASYYELEGDRLRGGLAVEAGETILGLTEPYAVVVSGPLRAESAWVTRVSEALAADPSIALGIAKDEHGAVLALRPSLLRRHAFPSGFLSMAFLVDFARQVIQAGERVIPLTHVQLAFDPVTPVFTVEAAAVSELAAAEEAFARGALEEGLDSLERAVTAQPRYKGALEATCGFFQCAGAAAEERMTAATIVKIDPRDARARARLGILSIAQGAVEDGLTQLGIAHALAADDPEIGMLYGEALTRAGRVAEASNVFFGALAASPDHVGAALSAADSLARLGEPTLAVHLLRELESKPRPALELAGIP